jgi:glucokinase
MGMPRRPVLAFDVGGTTVDAGLVTDSGRVADQVTSLPSPTRGDLDEVVGFLVRLMRQVAAGSAPVGAALAWPGPFDYEAGVPHSTHKFPEIRGEPLGRRLEEAAGMAIRFLNDADAFALGVWADRHRDCRRLVGITIGTGIGAGFVVRGELTNDDGAPEDGEIWNLPFRDGILEDYVSAGAVVSSYAASGGDPDLGAGEIAAAARSGERSAVAAYRALGEALGTGLAATTGSFEPERIVIGGRVGQSFDLFGRVAAAAYLRESGVPVPILPADTPHAALIGAAAHLRRHLP